ncbi:MAG: VWA domain-containing protein [Acidobacteria bacterium]|nr:VWA domain-containing protein [Acidobacteriota bacterium]
MFELGLPIALWLLPAPLLMLLLPAYKERRAGVRAPFFRQIANVLGVQPQPGAVVARRNWFQLLVAPVVWILLVLAVARPAWVEDPIERQQAARDLMLAIDLSGSMAERDFFTADDERTDRLTAVKSVLDGFIERRQGDRIGMIVFGNAAYIQAPFTLDHDLVRMLLDETEVAMAGPQTMLGDAVGLAIKHFDAAETDDRVLVLLTDGNDTGSRVTPRKAAELAADHDIKIYTIGVGDPESAGEAPLDIDTLTSMSTVTGGQFFAAANRDELEAVYSEIDRLQPQQLDVLSYRPRRQLFHFPLGAAAVLTLLYQLLMLLRGAATRGTANA